LRHFDPIRRAHLIAAQVEHARAGTRRREIEHRDDIARFEPAKQGRRPAQPDVHLRGRIPDKLELGRDVPELERHAQAPLDQMIARDDQPQESRQGDCHELQAEMTERGKLHQSLN